MTGRTSYFLEIPRSIKIEHLDLNLKKIEFCIYEEATNFLHLIQEIPNKQTISFYELQKNTTNTLIIYVKKQTTPRPRGRLFTTYFLENIEEINMTCKFINTDKPCRSLKP